MATAMIGMSVSLGQGQTPGSDGGSGFVPPQQLDGSKTKPTIGAGDAAQADSASGASKAGATPVKLFDQLMAEMNNLIPSELKDSPKLNSVIEEAITEFQGRNVKRSVEIFDEQVAADPEFPPSDLLLAALSFVVKDQKTGRQLLERAANNYPTSLAVYSAFSRLAINEGRVTDSLVHLEKMQALLSEQQVSEKTKKFYTVQYIDGMIDVAMRQQRLVAARELLEKQKLNLEGNPKVMMIEAELDFREKKIEKSLAILKKLKGKFGKTRAPESVLATWYQQAGDSQEAGKWVVESASQYPEDPQVQLEYASWLVNKEDFPTASDSIGKAEAINKESGFSKNLKAKIAFAKGSYVVAQFHYEALAKANPNNFDATNMYALALIESADEAKRQLALEIALRNYRALPNNLIAQAALGYIQLRLGNVEQAKAALARGAQSKRGVSPEIDFYVAAVLKELKEDIKARGVLEIALKHDGFFLYRGPAKKMLNDLGGPLPPGTNPDQSTQDSELPTPTDDK